MNEEMKNEANSFADYLLKKYNLIACTFALEDADGVMLHSSSGNHLDSLRGAAAAILLSVEGMQEECKKPKKGPGIRYN